jgi:hypothetical protein
MKAATGTSRKGPQTQFTGGMQAIREGIRITGQAILTIAFFGQGGRETSLPQLAGLLFAKAHVFSPK